MDSNNETNKKIVKSHVCMGLQIKASRVLKRSTKSENYYCLEIYDYVFSWIKYALDKVVKKKPAKEWKSIVKIFKHVGEIILILETQLVFC